MEPTPRDGPPHVRPPRAGSRGLLEASSDLLVWVLVLAGFFDGISDNWLHALVLLGAAAAVWWDTFARAAGRPMRPDVPLLHDSEPSRPWRVLIVLTVLAFSVVVGGFERYTWPPTVAVLLPAVAVLVIGWRGPLRPRPVPPPVDARSVWAWSFVLVAAGSWELVALLLQPTLQEGSTDHPTVSVLMDSVLAGHLGRSVTLALWLGLGWFLLAQAPGRERGEGRADDLA
jgi:hypothetical protein